MERRPPQAPPSPLPTGFCSRMKMGPAAGHTLGRNRASAKTCVGWQKAPPAPHTTRCSGSLGCHSGPGPPRLSVEAGAEAQDSERPPTWPQLARC
jgi:hypothetical protein